MWDVKPVTVHSVLIWTERGPGDWRDCGVVRLLAADIFDLGGWTLHCTVDTWLPPSREELCADKTTVPSHSQAPPPFLEIFVLWAKRPIFVCSDVDSVVGMHRIIDQQSLRTRDRKSLLRDSEILLFASQAARMSRYLFVWSSARDGNYLHNLMQILAIILICYGSRNKY